jgi:hypothetical protein
MQAICQKRELNHLDKKNPAITNEKAHSASAIKNLKTQ